jgi:hypothetical protein
VGGKGLGFKERPGFGNKSSDSKVNKKTNKKNIFS